HDRLHPTDGAAVEEGLRAGGARPRGGHHDPTGEMIANSVANFSQFERRLIGQRTKDALAVKRAQGVRLGRRPVMPAKVVRRIETMRKGGMSIRGIADRLNADGVPTAHGGARWHASTVQKVLG